MSTEERVLEVGGPRSLCGLQFRSQSQFLDALIFLFDAFATLPVHA